MTAFSKIVATIALWKLLAGILAVKSKLRISEKKLRTATKAARENENGNLTGEERAGKLQLVVQT